MTQEMGKNIGEFYYLTWLWSQGCNALLHTHQCAIGWPPLI